MHVTTVTTAQKTYDEIIARESSLDMLDDCIAWLGENVDTFPDMEKAGELLLTLDEVSARAHGNMEVTLQILKSLESLLPIVVGREEGGDLCASACVQCLEHPLKPVIGNFKDIVEWHKTLRRCQRICWKARGL